MEIKTVIKDKKFKHDYISINGSIHRLEDALASNFTNFSLIYETFDGKLKPAGVINLKFRMLPSYEKVLETIKEKRSEIYKQLSLKPSNKVSVKKEQATALLAYLCDNLTYDMSVKEDIFIPKNSLYIDETQRQRKRFFKAINLLNESLQEDNKKQITESEKTIFLEKIVERHSKKLDKLTLARDNMLDKKITENVVRGIYSSLIFKSGVCFDFSYAYAYLLNGLNIDNKVVSIKYNDKANECHHALSLVGFYSKKQNEIKYTYLDVTHENAIYQKHYKNANEEEKLNFKRLGLYNSIVSGLTQKDLLNEFDELVIYDYVQLVEESKFYLKRFSSIFDKYNIIKQIKTNDNKEEQLKNL